MINPTSRQEVLEASDEQLNEWAATVVMGWKCSAGERQTDGSFRHWWMECGSATFLVDRFRPVSDIAQAMKMVDNIGEEWSFSLHRQVNATKLNILRWHCECRRYSGHQVQAGYYEVYNDCLSRAITQACILAKLAV